MEYLALYRKYRPKELEEVVGQSKIKEILAGAIVDKTITHAYLFSGPRGTGKTTMARIFAKMVNCESPVNGNACNKCSSCLNILNSSDVIEIDAASNNGVDEIRDLREKANLVPTNAKYKVYIIDEVHMLTTAAFNALLKTLEEPPKHVIFILATTEYHKIPLTITSRCQKFQFSKISIEDIHAKLKEISLAEKIKIDDASLIEIAKISEGGMRDAINFLDQLSSANNKKITLDIINDVCGNVSTQQIVDLLSSIKVGNIEYVVDFFEKIDVQGRNYGKFFEDIICFLKDMILFKKKVKFSYIKNDVDIISTIAKEYEISEILYIIDEINRILDGLKKISRQSVYVISNFLLIINHICSLEKSDNSVEIVEKKEEMKEKKELTVDSVNNQIEEVNEPVNESVKLTEEESIETSNLLDNKEIIINNAFALANLEYKINLQKKFTTINDYLTDSKYKKIAGIFIDVNIEVAGDKYLILSAKTEAIIDKIYSNYKKSNEFLNQLLGGEFLFTVITREDWNKYRDKYIKDRNNNINYTVKELVINNDVNEENKANKDKTKKISNYDKLSSIIGTDDIIVK